MEKALEEFGRDKRATDGRTSGCLACKRKESAAYARTTRGKEVHRRASRKWKERNPEKWAASRKGTYAKHREERLAGMAKWRSENRESHRAAVKRWAKANPVRKLELQKEYAERHPEKVLANARRQDMRRRGKGDDPSPETREYLEILEHDPCCFCGSPKEEIEHIYCRNHWNLDLPGWNQWPNLSAACRECNGRKHEKLLLHFLLERSGDLTPRSA